MPIVEIDAAALQEFQVLEVNMIGHAADSLGNGA